jgi:hypothetical protein
MAPHAGGCDADLSLTGLMVSRGVRTRQAAHLLLDTVTAVGATYKARGILKRLAVTPVSAPLLVATRMATYTLLGVASGALMLLAGGLAGAQVEITPTWPGWRRSSPWSCSPRWAWPSPSPGSCPTPSRQRVQVWRSGRELVTRDPEPGAAAAELALELRSAIDHHLPKGDPGLLVGRQHVVLEELGRRQGALLAAARRGEPNEQAPSTAEYCQIFPTPFSLPTNIVSRNTCSPGTFEPM